MASLSTALAPPSLACPLPPADLHDCTTETFRSCPYSTPHVTRYLGMGIGDSDVHEVGHQRCPSRGTFRFHSQSSWARQGRSNLLLPLCQPTTPTVTGRNNACARACHHSFSRIRGEHISAPISRPINRRLPPSGSQTLPTFFQKREGVEGVTGFRAANGVEIPMREARQRI